MKFVGMTWYSLMVPSFRMYIDLTGSSPAQRRVRRWQVARTTALTLLGALLGAGGSGGGAALQRIHATGLPARLLSEIAALDIATLHSRVRPAALPMISLTCPTGGPFWNRSPCRWQMSNQESGARVDANSVVAGVPMFREASAHISRLQVPAPLRQAPLPSIRGRRTDHRVHRP